MTFVFFTSCKNEGKSNLFSLISSNRTGVSFSNELKDTPELNILRYLYFYNGAGVGIGDFNNDELEDLYFVSNQGENKLYINRENLQFEEVRSEVLKDNDGWSTGVTIVDINNDGLQDIYVCKVSNYRGLEGKNKLFVNQGVDQNGIPTFKEDASTYNLDISSFSTQAAFFDYDLDGDLDMYLLNHSVHPNRTYGRGTKRKQIDSLSGDKLYKNTKGSYKDVSSQAGIFQGAIGYGLGIATSDVNNDGYPDIYVTNDFFENDYLYINQKNGTFKEVISSKQSNIQHTSHFSMGVDIADINNDGLTDILSLDMLPDDIETYKSSGTEYGYSIYNQYLKNGYQPQYMQNALQINQEGVNFSEMAFFSGIAATEWSWAPLMADYDNDGYKDIFISNGIKGATNDMDFISFIANDNIQKRIEKGMTKEDLALIHELPNKKTKNYFFRNNKNLTFENVSDTWLENKPSYSNGAVYADLDNDGDLDIVTNNIDEKAFIYENKLDQRSGSNNYIKIKLKGTKSNPDAIGTKIAVHTKNKSQISEVFRTKGYLSSVSSVIHFGLGNETKIDSIKVYWPDGLVSLKKEIEANQILFYKKENTKVDSTIQSEPIRLLKKDTINVDYKHQDYESKDFSIEPLAPYANSNEGPHITVTDVNNDGLDDIFVPGGRHKAAMLFMQQTDGRFVSALQPDFEIDKRLEDIDQCFLDVDGDSDMDLITIYGGNEMYSDYQSAPGLFINDQGLFKKKHNAFPETVINASVVVSADIDNDGDLDVFVGSNCEPSKYGITPKNYLFSNDGSGNFSEIASTSTTELHTIGQVYDATFIDINHDTFVDLVIAGHYMPITILLNDGKGNFKKDNNSTLKSTHGWWNSIAVHDMDKDGDLDIIAGNWGLNSRLTASEKEPIKLYLSDFDDNGKIDPIVTYFYKGKQTPIATKDELVKQIPQLNKKYLSYTMFAKADFKDYFSKTKINNSEVKEVYILSTTYFENQGDLSFIAHKLPLETQVSSVHDILINDINNDLYPDIVMAGNTYEISTQLSRLDASYGVVLLNDQKGGFYTGKNKDFHIKGAVRSIKEIKIKDSTYLLFGINNDSLQVVKKIKK
ncbi:VCBS repeat-containing protein [Aquimarina mytili]|uniref:VCBS repeat-containing protein n=1 Tax=Aquimarina mytili TaxID=874423 RepID=A0A936ZM74_9FLAO|nr:VCBS repeat-containing protein [Aquimarina mytili]MBL0682214.1 VCBS repeat-containing protein [Aquimarina mytili]